MLKATLLKKTYSGVEKTKVEVLSGVSLELPRGKSIAICGRSGEGKSTLLHILGTLEPPDSGVLEIEGIVSTRSVAEEIRRRHIGFVFQSYNLLEDFTALENVLLPVKIARHRPRNAEGMALLESVGLEKRAHFPAKNLSGGERQRVAIARALINNPSIILADEPTGNLDAANAALIGDLLFALVKEKKKSLILVTHDTRLASLCDASYQLSSGKLN